MCGFTSKQVSTDTFDQDVALLSDFHGRAYDSAWDGTPPPTAEETEAAHQAWERLVNHEQTPGNFGVFALLLYTMKYLPQTELPEADEQETDVQPSIDWL